MRISPTLRAAANARTVAGPLLRTAYPIQVWGAHHIPTQGPLLLVGDQPELLAVALVKAAAPRPIHVIATPSVMQAIPARIIRAAGDIACVEPGIGAANDGLGILRDGGAVAVLGAIPAIGYLAAVSGAPVGTVVVHDAAGRVATDPPPLRRRIGVRFGPSTRIPIDGDPCALSTIRATGERIRQLLVDAQEQALARHGGMDEELTR